MIRVAIISYWHVHAMDYTKQAMEHPETEVVAIWDENVDRGKAKAQELGVTFYESLDQLLAQSDIDGVVITTPTSMHEEVMVKAAQAGKHIFTEKVIAPTLKAVKHIMDEVNQNDVKFTVSLPRLNHGYTLAIQKIIDEGVLGTLTLVRVRLSHHGATKGWLPDHFYDLETCGGGAMIDLGCHPMYLTRLFLGLPDSVQANYGYVTGKEVEDNAVAVLNYANGAIGVVEAGFVNTFSPFSIEVHGTEGTLLYGTPDNQLLLRTTKDGEAAAQSWVPQHIPSDKEDAFSQWVSHINHQTRADENIRIATDLTQLMEASNRSAARQQTIKLGDVK